LIIKDPSLYDQFEAVKLGTANQDLALGMFYAGLIRQMWVVILDHIPGGTDAAVMFKGTQAILMLTPAFFSEQPFAEQITTLDHELMHLVLKHTIIYKDFWNKIKLVAQSPGGPPQIIDLMNFGADLVANGYLPAKKVPDHWLKHEHFGMKGGLSALDYANEMLERLQGGGGSDGNKDSLPQFDPELNEELKKLLEAMAQHYGLTEGEDPTLVEPHVVWLEGHPDIGEADFDPEIAEVAIDQMILRAAETVPEHLRGNLPGVLKKVVEQASARSVVAWHQVLRRFNVSVGSCTIVPTMVRRNRITGNRPGNRIKPRWKLAIVLDGSASVDDSHWRQFVTEVHYAWKMGADITIIKHDAKIFSVAKYDGKNLDFDRTYGGTDHTEVIEYLNKHKFDGAVAFTDGGTWISKPIRPRCRFAWLITHDGDANVRQHQNCNFGQVITMKPPASQAA
jgi:predicted metal-dependent peptidase